MERHPITKHRNLEDFAEIASDWFWETDANHRFTFFSGKLESVLKINRKDVLGHHRVNLAEATLQEPKWQTHLADLDARRIFRNFEYQYRRPADGKMLWFRVSGQPRFDASGAFIGYRGVGNDITAEVEALEDLTTANAALAERNMELNETRRALERSANQDSLTNLLNRRAFERDLNEALAVPGKEVILMHIDLDRFKWINDTLGHQAGDAVLTTVAERIRHLASGTAPVYRVGGDEFQIVLADNADLDRARWIGDAVLEALSAPIWVGRQNTSTGASLGIACGIGGEITPSELTANADIALYDAKRGGRGCIRELTGQRLSQMAARRQLASEIPHALKNGEFIPFYQPQIDADTGAIIGVEALARWQHPEHGLLAPAAFLDLAAELGLVAALDRCMLEKALEFAGSVGDMNLHLPSISVNLSAGRLIDPHLVDDIEKYWTNRQCKLSIELLETISFDALQQETLVSENLDRLRAIGVQIETDDFGSGRASITSLLQVRPDRLKIDRKLIQAAVHDPVQRTVVSAILEMTRALGIETLAEGVETEQDVAIIRALGCRLFQGYAYARPLSEADFCTFLSEKATVSKTRTAGPLDLPKLA
ncbi:EAL domain-containing protein [Yoonia sp. GPGPB17]|uniref:EAL domain-containing protein n=1 Tax=Yoonia sp. GPGPB17 TaxID=3026147 RepID=UPI0030C3E857